MIHVGKSEKIASREHAPRDGDPCFIALDRPVYISHVYFLDVKEKL